MDLLSYPQKRPGIFYAVLAIPILIFLNILYVPFHAPDDYDHFKRAYSLVHANIWPLTESGKNSGGYVDSGLADMVEFQRQVIFLPHRETTLAMRWAGEVGAPALPVFRWSHAKVYSEYPGSSSYLPLIYLPQAFAVWAGEQLDLSVNTTVLAARLFNGLSAVTIIAWVLSRLPFGAAIVLAVLLLPKTLLQFASNSADPLIHAISLAIIAAAVSGLIGRSAPGFRQYLLMAFGLLVLLGVRPPLLPFALLPFALAVVSRNRWGGLVVVASVLLALAWFAMALPAVTDLRCGPAGSLVAKAQEFVVHGPMLIVQSFRSRLHYYVTSFIGELGWGNGPDGTIVGLPTWVYVSALAMLAIAAVHDVAQPSRLAPRYRFMLALCAAGVVVLIFFVMYGGCTPPGSDVIRGVQGRYLVSPLLLLVPAIAGLLPRRIAVPGMLG